MRQKGARRRRRRQGLFNFSTQATTVQANFGICHQIYHTYYDNYIFTTVFDPMKLSTIMVLKTTYSRSTCITKR